MRKKNFKGRCEKRTISKCEEVCRTFDSIQYAYADVLQASEDIKEIRCNVPLDGLPDGEYTSDFVCIKVFVFIIFFFSRFVLNAMTKDIGPTLPKYIVTIIIIFPHTFSIGVKFLVSPTVAVALAVSYNMSSAFAFVQVAKSIVDVNIIKNDMHTTATALLTACFGIVL